MNFRHIPKQAEESVLAQPRNFGAVKNRFFSLFGYILGTIFLLTSAISLAEEVKVEFAAPVEPMKFDPDKTYQAVIQTTKGTIVCDLYPQQAPLSVTNFINLARGQFYNGLRFHRVVPQFVIQGGDPDGNGTGGPGYTIPAEIGLKHTKGALAWARLPDQANPQKRSSGSQFYITLEGTPFLDGEYTVFGQTVSGMDVVEKIRVGDIIEKIDILVK